MDTRIYDVAGIGIGPFNLGLACLCKPINDLTTIFIDSKKEFSWHEGMLIPGTTLQVTWLADLVTLVDPSSKFSYLSYLREKNKILQFGIYEPASLTRTEFNRYCQWACSKLSNLYFGTEARSISYDVSKEIFIIHCSLNMGKEVLIRAKKIVLGVGAMPYLPEWANVLDSDKVIHSSNYLNAQEPVEKAEDIMIVGSGQSAGEIFYNLLEKPSQPNLSWVTRSRQLFAMEAAKMNFEFTSPDFIDYFFSLSAETKAKMLQRQNYLYKGISQQLLNSIYDRLYEAQQERESVPVQIMTNTNIVKVIDDKEYLEVELLHRQTGRRNKKTADTLILCTGYHYRIPEIIKGLGKQIQYDKDGKLAANRNYSIDLDNRVFVQNAELHTHGFNAPDIGLGPYRNAVIINSILGYDCYPTDTCTTFQRF
ncbi:lysine N(6)-hydroxylase/L-ornithine N(5)-oxygenase family protein [Niabella sp. CJ426]|uniref:lysine N(6)-hydroxylase/L-ornithine N(5)-oxygenase family protein n=1 Tax=Niabella sp. CJ426 TaxID=3393740 RepID=UPI003D06E666